MGRTACTSSVAPSPWRCCWTPRCPALPHLVAAFRQDSGLAYSEYGAALALFVETQHSRLCITQAAWHTRIFTHVHKYIAKFCRHIYQILSMIYTLSMQPRQPGLCHVTLAVCIVTHTVAPFLALHCVTGNLALWSDIYTKVSTSHYHF